MNSNTKNDVLLFIVWNKFTARSQLITQFIYHEKGVNSKALWYDSHFYKLQITTCWVKNTNCYTIEHWIIRIESALLAIFRVRLFVRFNVCICNLLYVHGYPSFATTIEVLSPLYYSHGDNNSYNNYNSNNNSNNDNNNFINNNYILIYTLQMYV